MTLRQTRILDSVRLLTHVANWFYLQMCMWQNDTSPTCMQVMSCNSSPQCLPHDTTNNTRRIITTHITHSSPVPAEVGFFSSFVESEQPPGAESVFGLRAAVSDLVYTPDWRSAVRAGSVFSVSDERDCPVDEARSHVCKVSATLPVKQVQREISSVTVILHSKSFFNTGVKLLSTFTHFEVLWGNF